MRPILLIVFNELTQYIVCFCYRFFMSLESLGDYKLMMLNTSVSNLTNGHNLRCKKKKSFGEYFIEYFYTRIKHKINKTNKV